MEQSILKSTKKILGLGEDYTPFDLDITTHINASLGVLEQLGVGPIGGFFIESDAELWTDIPEIPANQLAMVKTYIFLRVRLLFDPPTTSYHVTAAKEQLEEYESRLNINREFANGT